MRHKVDATIAPSQQTAEPAMPWLILLVAGLLEVGWAIGFKLATPT